MPSVDAYIGLGTNLGNRIANLDAALACLDSAYGLMAVSDVYETDPWGPIRQPAFLNAVARIAAMEPARALLANLRAIETDLGRLPGGLRYGPRLIDLDLLLYGDLEMNEPGLDVPHPRLAERAFALLPLADVARHVVVPGLGLTVGALMAGIDRSGVRLYRRPAGSATS